MRQNVLITGASRGLGYSIAERLAREGCRIILVSRSEQQLNSAISGLVNASEHLPLALDLTEFHATDQLSMMLARNGIVPDVVIHNLGGKVENDAHPLAAEVLRESMKLNVEVAVTINNDLIPLMKQKGYGKIIHISSDAAVTANAAPAYSAAKAALNAYIVNAARNYIRDNIVIYGVMPGIFEHCDSVWSQKKIQDPQYYQSRSQQMPLGRFMRVEEVAEVISSLCRVDSIALSGTLIKLNGAAP